MNFGGDAMRGQDGQTFAARVDESHHREFVGSRRVRIRGMKRRVETALVAIVERGFVTMMAVGDDELLFCHGGLDGGGAIGIGDDAQAVDHAEFIVQRGGGSGGVALLSGLHRCAAADRSTA